MAISVEGKCVKVDGSGYQLLEDLAKIVCSVSRCDGIEEDDIMDAVRAGLNYKEDDKPTTFDFGKIIKESNNEEELIENIIKTVKDGLDEIIGTKEDDE